MEAREPGRLSVGDSTRIGVVLAETIGGFKGEVRGELELKQEVCGRAVAVGPGVVFIRAGSIGISWGLGTKVGNDVGA
jgi:hypothetical protein